MRFSPTPDMEPVAPASPIAPWLGGKSRLAERIIARLAEVPHTTYVEPFIGMGGVFLRRPWRAKAEVINDINRDVTGLFRILQRHFVPFMDTLKWQLTTRSDFERLKASPPDTLTDLERAARFLYLQRTAFGGKVDGQNFGVSPGTPGRFDVTKLAGILEEVHERLAGVVIECLPWDKLMARYDRPATFFYLDPPYWGNETDYGEGLFGRMHFEHLADVLACLKGGWLLSLNDVPGVRRCFARFQIEAVETSYSIAGANRAAGKVGEVLISPRPEGLK